MTSLNRPPSCDRLLPRRGGGAFFSETPKPKLKECPRCGRQPIISGDRVRCFFHKCWMDGPINDSLGTKWNSIPRRSEVKELLRLVDEVTGWDDGLINQEEFDDGITMVGDIENLRNHADKLRKEWGLL